MRWRMQVYKGLWNEVQDVAVKMVVGQSAEQQARFLREVRGHISDSVINPLSPRTTSVLHGGTLNSIVVFSIPLLGCKKVAYFSNI